MHIYYVKHLHNIAWCNAFVQCMQIGLINLVYNVNHLTFFATILKNVCGNTLLYVPLYAFIRSIQTFNEWFITH